MPKSKELQASRQSAAQVQYAGFWLRFAAYIIDSIILNTAIFVLAFIVGIASVIFEGVAGAASGIVGVLGTSLIYILSFVGAWLYFAMMESSSKQGTLGKMALGMKVTDAQGRRISFGRATGRFFAKVLSALTLLVGYVMIGFTEKKQGLHDKIAETYVVMKK